MLKFSKLRFTWFAQNLKPFFKDQIYFSRTLHGMSCHLFNKMNHSVQTKLAVFQCLVLLFQLVSAHILARVRLCLFNSLQFFCVFFGKLKQKNTLNFTMQLCCEASDSMLGKIQGLFKTVQWNSRTFQEFLAIQDFSRIYYKIQDFSRLCEP